MPFPISFWTGGRTGDWSTQSNWSTGAVPTSGLAIDRTGVITATKITLHARLWLDYASNGPNGIRPVGLTLLGSNTGSDSYIQADSAAGPVNIGIHTTELHGSIAANSGSTIMTVLPYSATADFRAAAANFGKIVVNSYTNVPTGFTLIALNAGFSNYGAIMANANSSFSLVFGQNPAIEQAVGQTGTITAAKGGRVALNAMTFGATSSGVIDNSGQIQAAGGHVFLNTRVDQSGGGSMSVSKGGYLNVAGEVDDGTIVIKSGMLDFGVPPSNAPGPIAASKLHATVDFTGTDGVIAFGNPNIQETFRAATNDILVTAPWQGQQVQIADIHLGHAVNYVDRNFSTSSTGLLIYHDLATA